MEEFFVNMAIASFGLVILMGLLVCLLNWLEEQFLLAQTMGWSDVIMLVILFGVAALIASTM